MTEVELVRAFFVHASERDANFILWNCTAYPFCGLDHARGQLAELARKCQPTSKGWRRKVAREAARIDRDMMALCRADTKKSED